jgi:hypothetical protein
MQALKAPYRLVYSDTGGPAVDWIPNASVVSVVDISGGEWKQKLVIVQVRGTKRKQLGIVRQKKR